MLGRESGDFNMATQLAQEDQEEKNDLMAKNAEQHETVLVIDDEDVIRDLLTEYFAMENFPVLTAKNGQEGVEMFREHRPSIVVTDVRMPGMDGLGVLRAIRREDPEAKVVVMTGFGDGSVAFEALRAGASNYIKKPLSLEELLFIVRAHERMIRARKRQRLPLENLVRETKVLRLSNDQSQIHPAVFNVTQGLHAFMPAQDVESVSLALSEALVNGIEHGNLGIGFQQKSTALRESGYQELLEELVADPSLQEREIQLEYELTPGQAFFRVKDHGDGFDWRNRPDPTDEENLLRENGRGLSIIFLFMDEVGFNESGNEIWMVKKFPAPDGQ